MTAVFWVRLATMSLVCCRFQSSVCVGHERGRLKTAALHGPRGVRGLRLIENRPAGASLLRLLTVFRGASVTPRETLQLISGAWAQITPVVLTGLGLDASTWLTLSSPASFFLSVPEPSEALEGPLPAVLLLRAPGTLGRVAQCSVPPALGACFVLRSRGAGPGLKGSCSGVQAWLLSAAQ